MKRLRKTDGIIIIVLMLLIAFIAFMVVRGNNTEKNSGEDAISPTSAAGTGAEPEYTAYNGKRIGILTGSSFEPITLEKFPDSEYFYFNNLTDLIAALLSGKIDAFAEDEPTIKMICRQQKELGYLKKELVDDKYCFGFQKGTERSQKLQSEFNELLSELKTSGELDRICEKWFGEDESVKVFDDSELSGENGEIVAWTNPELQPFAYMADGKYKGISIELVTLFARKYGYSIRFEIGNLSSGIAGLTAGKYDILAGAASATEERKESMDFSDSFYDGGISLAVRASDLGVASETPQAVEDRTLGYYAANGKIGAITGGLYEIMIRERYPEAEILQYNSQPDLAIALSGGKIDAFTCPKSSAED
ncbi:MAG: transporter substrate-binding domain-containing protein, partial [Ruminococcus sp.]|nr:transporter substrate-binding domain-containing protein [Ruminococcus sp.]